MKELCRDLEPTEELYWANDVQGLASLGEAHGLKETQHTCHVVPMEVGDEDGHVLAKPY